MENLNEQIERTVRNWWLPMVGGILAIILGIWCLMTPDATLTALSVLFIAIFLLSGIAETIFALSNRSCVRGWGWTLTGGIIEILLGILLIVLPLHVTTSILIYLVGFWVLFRSLWGIGQARDMQTLGIGGWGWLLTLAILGVIFSLLYLISPVFGGAIMVLFISIALMIYGVYRIAWSLDLKTLRKYIDIK